MVEMNWTLLGYVFFILHDDAIASDFGVWTECVHSLDCDVDDHHVHAYSWSC